MGNQVITIPLLRVMHKLSLHNYIIVLYHYVIITRLQFEPYQCRPCGVTWDSSRTVVVIKLLRTSALHRILLIPIITSFASLTCCRALTRASGFPARYWWNHQHRLIGAAPASRTGVGTGSWRAPEQGANGLPPAAALPGQLCCQWILLYLSRHIRFWLNRGRFSALGIGCEVGRGVKGYTQSVLER